MDGASNPRGDATQKDQASSWGLILFVSHRDRVRTPEGFDKIAGSDLGQPKAGREAASHRDVASNPRRDAKT